MPIVKTDQPPEHWDQLFAPSSCLAMITTVDAEGRVNAGSFGTCTRVCHDPVYIAFTAGSAKHTAANVRATGQFTVNLPRHERAILEKVCVVSLPFEAGVSELDRAGLTALPAKLVKPPRIEECPRHFECEVAWTHEWAGRLMIVGKVVAVSIDADCVDERGNIVWENARPSHYAGKPYYAGFVAAYDKMDVDVPYTGPEAAFYNT
jgi:flavin reductase (DIM6/NTAB) family NADH-FMN oxidoreductase RutF